MSKGRKSTRASIVSQALGCVELLTSSSYDSELLHLLQLHFHFSSKGTAQLFSKGSPIIRLLLISVQLPHCCASVPVTTWKRALSRLPFIQGLVSSQPAMTWLLYQQAKISLAIVVEVGDRIWTYCGQGERCKGLCLGVLTQFGVLDSGGYVCLENDNRDSFSRSFRQISLNL